MKDIKIFINPMCLAGSGWNFFALHITVLFNQSNDENMYQQFYYCLHYIFYS